MMSLFIDNFKALLRYFIQGYSIIAKPSCRLLFIYLSEFYGIGQGMFGKINEPLNSSWIVLLGFDKYRFFINRYLARLAGADKASLRLHSVQVNVERSIETINIHLAKGGEGMKIHRSMRNFTHTQRARDFSAVIQMFLCESFSMLVDLIPRIKFVHSRLCDWPRIFLLLLPQWGHVGL